MTLQEAKNTSMRQFTEWEVWKALKQENDLKDEYPRIHRRSKLLPKIDEALQGNWTPGFTIFKDEK